MWSWGFRRRSFGYIRMALIRRWWCQWNRGGNLRWQAPSVCLHSPIILLHMGSDLFVLFAPLFGPLLLQFFGSAAPRRRKIDHFIGSVKQRDVGSHITHISPSRKSMPRCLSPSFFLRMVSKAGLTCAVGALYLTLTYGNSFRCGFSVVLNKLLKL